MNLTKIKTDGLVSGRENSSIHSYKNRFVPAQVESREAIRKVAREKVYVAATTAVSKSSEDEVSVYMSAETGPMVTPMKANINLPSWLGVSDSSSRLSGFDSSSDTDNDNNDSLPASLALRNHQKTTKGRQDSSAQHYSLPPWLRPEDTTIDESDSSEARAAATGTDTEAEVEGDSAEYLSNGLWPCVKKETEVVYVGQVIEEKEGSGVEFWEVDDLSKLCPTTLAVILCGMLNSGSGVVWAGVGKDGAVKGCEMGRVQRDKIRQMLDRVCSTNISPRVGPREVDIDFVRVDGGEELWLIKYIVRLNQEVLYRAINLPTSQFSNGVYVRNSTGPEFTEFVPDEVLKMIHDEL